MQTGKVSIILPTFNRAKTLGRAIDSVLEQDFVDWELCIVDDDSKDETESVVKKYLSDSRIKYWKINHLGQVGAREFAIKNSQSPYIAFLDSDDFYKPNHLGRAVDFLEKTPDVDLVQSRVLVIGDHLVHDMTDLNKMIDVRDCNAMGTIVMRRNLYVQLGGLDEAPLGVDYLFIKKLERNGNKRAWLDGESYVMDRTGNDSITKNFAKERNDKLN